MEEAIYPAVSPTIYQLTRQHIPEDVHLHQHCSENLKSHEHVLPFHEFCDIQNVTQQRIFCEIAGFHCGVGEISIRFHFLTVHQILHVPPHVKIYGLEQCVDSGEQHHKQSTDQGSY